MKTIDLHEVNGVYVPVNEQPKTRPMKTPKPGAVRKTRQAKVATVIRRPTMAKHVDESPVEDFVAGMKMIWSILG